VAMTRHREGVELYAGRDDFKRFEEIRERLSRARPKDSTLDYAERRGLLPASYSTAERRRTARVSERQAPRSQTEQAKPVERAQSDPISRFKDAQREFIQVAGVADFDPRAKARAGELRAVMRGASEEIAKDPARMRVAEREGIASQVKNFVRQAGQEREHPKTRGRDRDEGLER
jgi:hypothetical protein